MLLNFGKKRRMHYTNKRKKFENCKIATMLIRNEVKSHTFIYRK